MNTQKAIIFDLDGTLIDSLEDIAVCMNQVFAEMELPTHEINDYKKFVGGGVDILVENALADSQPKEIKKQVSKRFKEVYDQNLHAKTLPYDGIYELLEQLEEANIKMAILSNKPHKFTCQYAQSLFKDNKFLEVHGQKEHINKKPDPKAAIDIANNLNINCENIYFVGDTKIDMQTAKNANMKAIGVLWGFREEDELRKNGADFIVEKPSDIFDIISNKL
ncbi:HAD family hydrolase [Poseidonibacter lekithochrous]|uniref:HAD family hydrolase n=1 Tax=Poseidonibacter lekithochrous TaxID=1904463 RepID=UPI0008FC2CB1|nr:HAD family hydrolase [Poseidonibacter lekithochrous]QKJ24594.1 phosphoglycolate phosphatase [Poseidonibacter lekithochrous]